MKANQAVSTRGKRSMASSVDSGMVREKGGVSMIDGGRYSW